MYVVSRMGSAVTRAPEAVMLAGTQLKSYLATTAAEGLKFDVKEKELPVLTVYADAFFALTLRNPMAPSSSFWDHLQSSGGQADGDL